MVSLDGATWSIQTNDSPVAFTKVIYEHGIYLATGWTNAFFTSTNGTNWIARHFPSVWNDFYPEGVTFANSKAVAIAFTRNGLTFYSVALTSEPLVDIKAQPVVGQLGIFGVAGASYRIEYADSLGSSDNIWHPLASFSLSNSPYVWWDVTTGIANSRFYRAVLLP
jgi:hypothetical protein